MCSDFIVTKYWLATLVLAIVLSSSACGALQPPDANGPRGNLAPYPIVLTNEREDVRDRRLAWRQLSQRYGLPNNISPSLDPLTATITSLPDNTRTPVLLPKVGIGPTQTEEETRESLRRFIVEWRRLIGADPSQMSLVERTDEPSGIKLARYEQRPFRYPLRGGFGNLIIKFRADRQVLELSSNCIPNTDRLQASLSALTPKVTSEDAASHVKAQSTIVNPAGQQQNFTLPSDSVVEVRQLVVYALPSKDQQNVLEVRLAWEIAVTNAPIKTIYLDAVADQVIAVSQA
jgi:hypothetical protein